MRYSRSSIAWLPETGHRADGAPSKGSSSTSSGSLRLQLVFLVTFALLPMAVWSFVQGMQGAARDSENVRELLSATARAASTPEQNVLASADQVARAVANLPDVRNATTSCSQQLSAAERGLMFFTNISRRDASGKILCAAQSRSIGLSAPDPRAWARLKTRNAFIVDGEIISRVSNQPVIIGLLPLHTPSGAFEGAIGITIDVQWLDHMIRSSALPADSIVALFDRSGTIMGSNRPDTAAAIFRMGRGTDAGASALSKGQDSAGHTWIFATHPLLGDNVFVGFAMRQSSLLGPTYIHLSTDFVLPFLLITLSWLVIWIVTERQLTRWIIYLRRISDTYRAGHYTLKPSLKDAPSEFRMLGSALSEMAAAIQDRDRSLRDALAQKTVLIKEIHHRVKNNLQIVMSLLSLQAGRLSDPTAQAVLTQARMRINALALVHRILYEIEDRQSVDIKQLLEQLAEQTNDGFGGGRRDIRVSVKASSLNVTGDVAVPIALFAVEALTNAYKHAFPPGRGGTIRVIFARRSDGAYRLAVEDDGVGFDTEAAETSIGRRLIRTFGHQLGGETSLHSSREYGTVAEMNFPAPRTAE
jgi:two-component sensor histidine kinase